LNSVFLGNSINSDKYIIFALGIVTFKITQYKTKQNRKMEELVNKIKAEFKAFTTDADLQVEKGNKSAGTRARKSSLDLEKLLKEFRKLSIEESKK